MSNHPPADDPYNDPHPAHFAPADRAARLKIALQLCMRRIQDLRALIADVEVIHVRKMLYGYVVMEMYEGRLTVEHISNEVKDGRDLPPDNNDISDFVSARRAFDTAQRAHLPGIGTIRNNAVAHVDKESGTADLRTHVDLLTAEHVEPVAMAFAELSAAIRGLPIGRFYATPAPNQRIVMMRKRSTDPSSELGTPDVMNRASQGGRDAIESSGVGEAS